MAKITREQLENEVIRLQKIIEDIALSYDRDSRDAEGYDEQSYYASEADDLRREAKSQLSIDLVSRYKDADRLVSRAEWKVSRAESELRTFRSKMREVILFTRWLQNNFGKLFNIKDLAEEQYKFEQELRNVLVSLVERVQPNNDSVLRAIAPYPWGKAVELVQQIKAQDAKLEEDADDIGDDTTADSEGIA